MRHVSRLQARRILAACVGLVASCALTGCTHNHYYSYNPCAPGTTTVIPSGVAAGPVCEVPSAGGSTVVGGRPSSDPVIVGSGRPPKYVVSQPGKGSLSWRSADPDGSMMTTKVDGAVDSPSVTR
ncbi:MAG: hypothetical protein U0794_02450 [Isosphaeraceae bacterium]